MAARVIRHFLYIYTLHLGGCRDNRWQQEVPIRNESPAAPIIEL